MTHDELKRFRDLRRQGNEAILGSDHLGLKRFLRLDQAAYDDAALPARTKELLGLVASLVLRCDDCVTYHLEQCVRNGWSRDEIIDAFNVPMIVGGSVIIPHLRRALLRLDELLAERDLEESAAPEIHTTVHNHAKVEEGQ